MTTEPSVNAGSPGLVDRAKNILLQPRAEWDRIAVEPTDIGKLYMGYALPLAALAAICMIIGFTVFGVGGFGVTLRFSPVDAVVAGVVQLIMAVVGVFVVGIIINALAPNFGSTPDQLQAHKVSVYSYTASLLSGVFMIYPPLGPLGILGLYSFVLLYLGLPRLMKTPEDKRVGYFVTIIVVAIVVGFVIGIVSTAVRGAANFASPGVTFGQSAPDNSSSSGVDGTITLPGGGSVDLSELEKMGEAYSSGEVNVAAIDPTQLQGFLPQALPGGFTQTSLSSGTGGAMGMNASQAEAVYTRGDARMTVTIVHMGAMGGLASMAGAMGVQQSRQDADGFSRTNTVDGRVITEELSRSANHASYGVVGRGVALTAEGSGITVEEARAAVEAIGVQRVEAATAQPG
ncbi:MAG: Yip1 family protein [Hyphomonadaceae bacterium]|nr:Yip1 family protein [Hyphomonadaceae bacterium]